MKQTLKQNLISGSGKAATVLADYALEFNGTDEYLQIALPNNELLASAGVTDFYSSGSAIAGWTESGTGTVNWASGVSGKTYTETITLDSDSGISKTIIGLIVGQKYKLKIRCQTGYEGLCFGTALGESQYDTLIASSGEWNTVSKVFTAESTELFFSTLSTSAIIDYASVKRDLGFDLNKDQEQIKDSKNWDFERTLISNYSTDFSTSTGWVLYDSAITGNQLVVNKATAGTFAVINLGITTGKRYVVKFDISEYTSGEMSVILGGYNGSPSYYSGVGSYSYEMSATYPLTDAVFYLYAVGSFVGKVDNLFVYEIPNLVTNGGFDSDTVWAKGTGWTIAGDKASCDGTEASSNLHQACTIIINKRYRVTFTVSDYVSGAVAVNIGGYTGLTLRSADGTYTEDITVSDPATINNFFIIARSFIGSVDNVHCYEIPEWTATGNHTQNLSILDKSGTGVTNTHSMLVTASGAGDSTTNHVKLPSANIESVVSGKKYTLEGFARLDPTSLTYGSPLSISGSFEANNGTIGNGWNTRFGSEIVSIVTGNGFTTSAQRFVTPTASGGIFQTVGNEMTGGKVHRITFTYRSSNIFFIYNSNSGEVTYVDANTGNAITATVYTTGVSPTYLYILTTGIGHWVEVDDISIVEATPPTITAQLGTKSVTSSALSIVAGTFTKFVLNFEATASEQSQDLKLYLSGAGSVFVDKLSLTQALDSRTYLKIKPTEAAKRTVYNIDATNFLEFRADGKIGVSFSDGTNTVTNIAEVAYTVNEWIELIIELNRTGNVKIIKNNGTPTGTAITTVGKAIKTATTSGFRIGANASGAETFKGQIAKIVRTRFDNLTGLVGSEEVLNVTFQSGVSIAECLKDYSPKGHTVTGVNVDITNRRRVATYETEAQTIFNSLTGYYTDSRRSAINNLVLSLKTAGVWAKLDVLQVYSAINSADALINWKTPGTFNATLVNAPTFTANTGIAGNGTTSYINSGYNPTTALNKYILNSGFIGVYSRSDINEAMALVNNQSGPSNYISGIEFQKTAPYVKFSINGDTQTSFSSSVRQGFFVASRTGVNTIKGYINGTLVVSDTVSSSAIYGANIFVGAKNNGGSAAGFATHEISMFMAGSGLNDSEVLSLYSAVEAYLDNIGAGIVV